MIGSTIEIHYHRLPDRLQLFRQTLIEEASEYLITYLERAALPRPVRVGERTVLEPDAPVIWFTYPGRWYDIGSFHLADGTFTGIYTNLITPVQIRGTEWSTTDLCLDIWTGVDGAVELLDLDEFDEAVGEGWLEEPLAGRARTEADGLLHLARQGEWPPSHVQEWTLERARARFAEVKGLGA